MNKRLTKPKWAYLLFVEWIKMENIQLSTNMLAFCFSIWQKKKIRVPAWHWKIRARNHHHATVCRTVKIRAMKCKYWIKSQHPLPISPTMLIAYPVEEFQLVYSNVTMKCGIVCQHSKCDWVCACVMVCALNTECINQWHTSPWTKQKEWTDVYWLQSRWNW